MSNAGYRYDAIVTRVIDGDTVKVAIDLGFGVVFQTKLRLAGIDSAELKSKIEKNRQKAQEAKEFVEKELLNKEIELKSLKTGKYGRYIAFIYLNGEQESFNDRMVKEGYAAPYNGGKRTNL